MEVVASTINIMMQLVIPQPPPSQTVQGTRYMYSMCNNIVSGHLPNCLLCVGTLCPSLPRVTNGSISYSPDKVPDFDLGTIVTYTCDQGFFLSDANAATRTCIEQSGVEVGVWNGVAPTCQGECHVIM